MDSFQEVMEGRPAGPSCSTRRWLRRPTSSNSDGVRAARPGSRPRGPSRAGGGARPPATAPRRTEKQSRGTTTRRSRRWSSSTPCAAASCPPRPPRHRAPADAGGRCARPAREGRVAVRGDEQADQVHRRERADRDRAGGPRAPGPRLESYRASRMAEPGVTDDFVRQPFALAQGGAGACTPRRRPGRVVAARGSIFDVVVDLRREPPTYGQWEGFALDDVDDRELDAPGGSLTGSASPARRRRDHKVSTDDDPEVERAIAYETSMSARVARGPRAAGLGTDRTALRLQDVAPELPFEPIDGRFTNYPFCQCGGPPWRSGTKT